MEQENKPRGTEENEPVPAAPGDTMTPEQKKPYDKKTRALAWVGIAFMVFLTIMYFYVFYSGKILLW
jgi:hypothetical protein